MALENKPGIQLTGDEEKDKGILLENEVARLVKENLHKNAANLTEEEKAMYAATGGGNEKPQPFKMTLFGREVEYPDQATAMAEVEKAMLQLTTQLNEKQKANGQGQGQEAPAADVFDREKMAKLIDENVLEGLRYAMDYIPEIKQMKQDNATLKQALAVHQFRSNTPNFTADPQNVQVINGILAELGLPPDRPASLEAAYAVGVGRGWIRPQQPENNQQMLRQRPITPPFQGRGQNAGFSVTPDFEAMVNKLSKEQIKQLIDSGRFR